MVLPRRHLLALLAGAAATPALAQAPAMNRITAFAFSFSALDGGTIRLADHAGKPILVVNTASLCGYTPQYTGLQEVWTRFKDRGLLLVGVPSNDFGGQEPGGASEIDETAHHQYGVTFPITEQPGETPRWNFHKYLIGRDGHIAAVFPSAVEPTDTRLITAIAKELGSGG
jgi:glutathione peroxidase